MSKELRDQRRELVERLIANVQITGTHKRADLATRKLATELEEFLAAKLAELPAETNNQPTEKAA